MQSVLKPDSKVLVTGGAGFIGSHLVERLVNDDYHVVVLDNLLSGKLANIEGPLRSGKVDFVEGDIRDASIVKKSLVGVDVVAHLAALVSVPLSIEDPKSTFDVNLLGTLNLLNLCAKEKIKRFVFISSCAVLGDTKSLPVTEEAQTNPISPYADSKLLAERYCLGYNERELLEAVVLRFFNVYGPRQTMNDYSGVITLFIERCRQGLPLTVYGDGSQTRDFVNVKDVADAVFASMVKTEAKGEIFNVGSGKPTSIKTLAKTVLDLAGKNLEIKYEKSRTGDIKDSYADISKAKKLLGYAPKVSLSDGLRALMKEKGL